MSPRKKNKIDPIPLFIVGGGLLLIVAAFILANNQISAPAPTPAISHEEETYPDIPRVTLEEARTAFDSGSAIFVDGRSAEAYQGNHIAGAVNIPLGELEERLGELDPNQWIITYCT